MRIRNYLAGLLWLLCSASHALPQLPAWQGMAYEQTTLWATAQSVISIDAVPGDAGTWKLTASSSVARNSEEVVINFSAATGRTLDRTRLSRGKDQRVKSYEYGDRGIIRERREPADGPDQPQSQWQVTSQGDIPYPGNPDMPPVTAAYTLTVLADRFRQSDASTAEFVVHTDLNFYRVTLSRGGNTAVEVDYEVKDEGRIRGERQAEVIKVTASPEGQQQDKPDFSLLGLSGDITLLYDAESGLLLRLAGRAPRIGKTSIDLTAATFREKP